MGCVGGYTPKRILQYTVLSNHTRHRTSQAIVNIRVRRWVRVRIWGLTRAGGGGRSSCVARSSPVAAHLLQHCSTVNRRPVPYKACHPASSQTPDAPRASICTSQPCFVVVKGLFLGQRTTWKLHPSIPRSRRIPWQQMEKSSVAVPQPKQPPFPAGRELTAGSLGKSRVHNAAEDPGFSPAGAWHNPGSPAQKGKYSTKTCLGAPQLALPCLMHLQEFTTDIVGLQRQRLSNLLREAAYSPALVFGG